jgi:cyclopropane fatty-acyl-phospholipid synthase-like methyltransferase
MTETKTSQDAPLERFLARQRCNRIQPYVHGKRVLDFGCGVKAWNAIAIQDSCLRVDGVDRSLQQSGMINAISLYQELSEIQETTYDVIMALAVFEHIKPLQLRGLLHSFHRLSHEQTMIIGTVPSRRSRRVLELLSYKLKLIDRTQIEDHKVYYDDLWMGEIVEGTGWQLSQYKSFQLGMNCFFELRKST